MTMPDFWTVLSTSPIDLLGWTLLHFVWQGALMAAVLAGALYVLQRHPPRVRYAVSCAALVGLLALPLGTGVLLSERGTAVSASASGPTTAELGPATGTVGVPLTVIEESAAQPPSWTEQAAAWCRPALPWIVVAWGFGVLIFSVRLAGGAWRVRRLRRTSTEAASEWQDRLQELAAQIGLRHPVPLRRSAGLNSPVAAGWWRPVVLVPTGFLTGLPPDQVEALLLHELAHIRRHDVLVGRVQAVVEILLFFHPATWWISRQVRETREACCDDLAVRAGTDRTVYARALTALAERTVAGASPAWAPAASNGSLLARIRRLMTPTPAPAGTMRRLSMAAAVLLVVGVPLGLAACASQQSAVEVEADQEVSTGAAPQAAPDEPRSSAERDEGAVVLHRDSNREIARRPPVAPVDTEDVEDDVYVYRYDGDTDTLDLPHPDNFFNLDSLRSALVFDRDSLERLAFRMEMHSDSLERALERAFNPDSLERRMRHMRLNADSLAAQIERHIHPERLERALQFDFDADSLERALELRFRPDSIARHARRMQLHVDSLLQKREFRAERLHLDVDSLRRRARQQADSLRLYMERMRGEWAQRIPDQLRDQARRLREQAERLEERAERMEQEETPPPTPSSPDSADAPDAPEEP